MMFENNLTPEPTLRSRVVDHVPIAIMVGGLLATLVSLHLAVTGVLVVAAAHVLLGLVLLVIRRQRTTNQPPADAVNA